jgi:hypothetical protein
VFWGEWTYRDSEVGRGEGHPWKSAIDLRACRAEIGDLHGFTTRERRVASSREPRSSGRDSLDRHRIHEEVERLSQAIRAGHLLPEDF